MINKDIIRMEPVEIRVRIGEHVSRFTYEFPPFRVLGRVLTEDDALYVVDWNPQLEPQLIDELSAPEGGGE